MNSPKILVLCTGNSCRSVMAEGLLNHYGKGRLLAYSAGSFPTGKVHPMSLATLKRHGITDEGYRSKSWNEFKEEDIDVLLTVCSNAAGEVCPVFPGNPIKAHWGVDDPAHFKGSPEEVNAEFDRVFVILEKRVKALLNLSFEKMNKSELQKKLMDIGEDRYS